MSPEMAAGTRQQPVDSRGHQYSGINVTGAATAQFGDRYYYHTSAVQRPNSTPLPSFNVPFSRDQDFVNRGDILNIVDQKLERGGARVALVGIGGVGKSQLAIEYSYQLRDRQPDTWVFWVHASNPERLKQDFWNIAQEIGIPERNDLNANIFGLVKKWLQSEKNGKWLLILDNIDSERTLSVIQQDNLETTMHAGARRHEKLSSYIPQSPNGATLITSRSANVANLLVECCNSVPIGPMEHEAAVKLLSQKLPSCTDSQSLLGLVDLLEYMPLAIVQAAAFIQRRGPRYSVRRYVDDFQKSDRHQTSLLDYEAGHLRRDEEAKNSIIITWQISFDYIRENHPASADLLSLMSYCDRQGIPEFLLRARASPADNFPKIVQNGEIENDLEIISDFEESVQTLRDYMFISFAEDEHTFSMHRLVQLATRTWLTMRGRDKTWKASFVSKLDHVFPDIKFENWSRCESLLPHVKSAERQPIDSGDDQTILRWARTLSRAGMYVLQRGYNDEALRLCRAANEAIDKVSDVNRIEIAIIKSNLADVYLEMKRYREAEELQIQVIEISRRAIGPDHPTTLVNMSLLAMTYANQRRWQEAEALGIKVTERLEKNLGPEQSVILAMGGLASTYISQQKTEEAEALFMRIIEVSESNLGPEQLPPEEVLRSYRSVCHMLGKLETAEVVDIWLLEKSKREYGLEHPLTLDYMYNLACTYLSRDCDAKAIAMMRSCYELRVKVLGTHHQDTRDTGKWLDSWA